jgi:hypothetical protein
MHADLNGFWEQRGFFCPRWGMAKGLVGGGTSQAQLQQTLARF